MDVEIFNFIALNGVKKESRHKVISTGSQLCNQRNKKTIHFISFYSMDK